jgi:hypothetical protein
MMLPIPFFPTHGASQNNKDDTCMVRNSPNHGRDPSMEAGEPVQAKMNKPMLFLSSNQYAEQ